MNYEKEYKEALERARNIRFDNPNSATANVVCESIFPELKESEDERIRKELIRLLNTMTDGIVENYTTTPLRDFIAWLEKQDPKKFEEELEKAYKFADDVQYRKGYEDAKREIEKRGEESDYNPYKATIESISAMVEKYANNGDLRDFYDNIKVKCKDAMEYDNTWLGKQGGQKPADKIEPKFKVGDWVVFNNDHNSVYQVEKIENYEYTLRHILGGSMPLSFSHGDMIRAWTIEDAKDGDVLAFDNGHIILVKENYNSTWGWRLSCWCHLLDEEFEVVEYYLKTEGLHPATKEQRDLLFQKMKESGYEWDSKKKELKKIEQKPANSYCKENCKGYQETGKCFTDGECKAKREAEQKPAWSKEDKFILKDAIAAIDMMLTSKFQESNPNLYKSFEVAKDWLKSLKPQPHWKPTDEQMNLLSEVQQALLGKDCHNRFVNFMYDLKKL